MTKQEYWDKMENVLLGCPDLWWNRWNVVTTEYLDTLYSEIAKLQADNKSLVEQMNEMAIKYESLEQHCIALEEDINMWQASGAMALKPNQELITWHKWPEEKPDMTDKKGFKNKNLIVKYTHGDSPEELVGIDTYWDNPPYIMGFYSTIGECIRVLSWAYLPKVVK